MKSVKLLHNPKAGSEDHSKKALISLVEANGYKCDYSSVKKEGWEEMHEDTDLIVIAGGDGTIGKVTKQMLRGKTGNRKLPAFTVLPCGTANNISKSLGFDGDIKDIMASWRESTVQKFDAGIVKGLDEKDMLFLEAVGFGVFPATMKKMKKADPKDDDPEEKIALALELFKEVVESYEAETCEIEIDGKNYSGQYLMVEIMNIKSIGPNLDINASGDAGDGFMDAILVPESKRGLLLSFAEAKINNTEPPVDFSAIRCKQVKIRWAGDKIHVDDERISLKKMQELNISVQAGALECLACSNKSGANK